MSFGFRFSWKQASERLLSEKTKRKKREIKKCLLSGNNVVKFSVFRIQVQVKAWEEKRTWYQMYSHALDIVAFIPAVNDEN